MDIDDTGGDSEKEPTSGSGEEKKTKETESEKVETPPGISPQEKEVIPSKYAIEYI